MYTIDKLNESSKKLGTMVNSLSQYLQHVNYTVKTCTTIYSNDVVFNLQGAAYRLGSILTKLSDVITNTVSDVNTNLHKINTLSNAVDILSEKVHDLPCTDYDFYAVDYMTFNILDRATSITTNTNTTVTKLYDLSVQLNNLSNNVLISMADKISKSSYTDLVDGITNISNKVDTVLKRANSVHDKLLHIENKISVILDLAALNNEGKVITKDQDYKYACQLTKLLCKARRTSIERIEPERRYTPSKKQKHHGKPFC